MVPIDSGSFQMLADRGSYQWRCLAVGPVVVCLVVSQSPLPLSVLVALRWARPVVATARTAARADWSMRRGLTGRRWPEVGAQVVQWGAQADPEDWQGLQVDSLMVALARPATAPVAPLLFHLPRGEVVN